MNCFTTCRIEIPIIRYQGMNHKVECIISPIPSVYNKHSININEEGERSEGEKGRTKPLFIVFSGNEEGVF